MGHMPATLSRSTLVVLGLLVATGRSAGAGPTPTSPFAFSTNFVLTNQALNGGLGSGKSSHFSSVGCLGPESEAGGSSSSSSFFVQVGCPAALLQDLCGDTTVRAPEECDNGFNNAANKPCTTHCLNAVCGDGLVCSDPACTSGVVCADAMCFTSQPGPEECDGGIGCTSTCQLASGDDDGDNVDAGLEDGAPDNGDGNGDGEPDSVQSNVASLPSAVGPSYLTVEVPLGQPNCSNPQLKNVAAVNPTALGHDVDFVYPLGMVRFKLNCTGPVQVRVIMHGVNTVTALVYRKFGHEAPDFAGSRHFYTLPSVVFSTEPIPSPSGPITGVATLTLENGQLGDDTDASDLMIVDPGGPATQFHAAVPIGSNAWLVLMILALSVGGAMTLRRRTPATSVRH